MLTEKKLNEKHAPTEVWVTHHALDTSEPEHQWLDGVSKKPWDTDYKAPMTDWAANTRYVRADMVDARDEVIRAMIEGWHHFFDTSDRLYGDTEKIEAAIDAAMRALA